MNKTKTLSEARNELRGKHYKLSSYLKKAAQIKANNISTDTPAHLACNLARDKVFCKSMKEDLIILQVPLDLKEIMPKKNKSVEKDILRDIACGRFGKDEGEYSHYYEYLYENIQHCISEKKVIFIMFALESYCVIETRNTKTKRPDLEYSTHSTCLILTPNDEKYEAYYINSHGRDMSDTDIFRRIISSKRTHVVEFDKPTELVLISDLINYWNTLKDYNDENINIKWNDTKTNTYLGVNLQAGDHHGICFAYPQIILHSLGETFDTKREINETWGTISVNSTRDLLKSGNLNAFVKLAFMNFDTCYDKMVGTCLLEKRCDVEDDAFEVVLEKRKTLFTKNIVASLIRYLSQISFKIQLP